MRRLLFSISIALLLNASNFAWADHSHAKHNMILFGEKEIFASHIVYKAPHNYQVILALNLDGGSLQEYQSAKAAHPEEQFIYLLDPMDIKDIDSVDQISGPVFYVDAAGQNHEVIQKLVITRMNFKTVYFDELPLSLGADSSPPAHLQMQPNSIKCDDSDIGHVPSCTPQPQPCPRGRKC